jgi:hypothetical protein
MTHVMLQPQQQQPFASPPANGGLPYPSFTPYPSRDGTPSILHALAQQEQQEQQYSGRPGSSSSSGSNNSFATTSVSRWKSWRSSNSSGSNNRRNNIASSVGNTPKPSFRRSHTLPWKTPTTPAPLTAPPPPYHHNNIRNYKPNNKMAYYGYYQQQAPNWATSQYEPIAPPMPTYHPTPNCEQHTPLSTLRVVSRLLLSFYHIYSPIHDLYCSPQPRTRERRQ